MSVPGNINTAPPPSSFDDDPEFYEESRWTKLKRRLMEEPLIPLGCALTCWALFEATKSIRGGDKEKTNRMFRRRIYAQGFTILAMFGGSIYWEADRQKRKEFTGLLAEKKKKEKHEAWIKELEIRDQEENELRKMKEKIQKGQQAERSRIVAEAEEKAKQAKNKVVESVRSVVEESERRGPILSAVMDAWMRRR
jgi:hypothetical protein